MKLADIKMNQPFTLDLAQNKSAYERIACTPPRDPGPCVRPRIMAVHLDTGQEIALRADAPVTLVSP